MSNVSVFKLVPYKIGSCQIISDSTLKKSTDLQPNTDLSKSCDSNMGSLCNLKSARSVQVEFSSKGPIESRVEKLTGINKDWFHFSTGAFSSPRIVKPLRTNGHYKQKNTANKVPTAKAISRVREPILLDNFRVQPIKRSEVAHKKSCRKSDVMLSLMMLEMERLNFLEILMKCSGCLLYTSDAADE
eukprot:TRINITY_DN9417_c0_g1_i1.p1 TRINITY_DN9417_c0_g1~~TRINITY_DN9417_c0_g1_i1.p1  ORF type:complete len:187 (-),score=34.26 TRINITY_DN9417_c0_g1_i1:47-607(-)